jgi:hypothetical protein
MPVLFGALALGEASCMSQRYSQVKDSSVLARKWGLLPTAMWVSHDDYNPDSFDPEPQPPLKQLQIPDKYFVCLFLAALRFELRTSGLLGRCSWAIPTVLFCAAYFWDRVLWTICLGWLQTTILLISASWVARITGMSHGRPTKCLFFKSY